MGRTEIRSHQVFDGSIGRADLNVTSPTESVIQRILISSTVVLVKSSTGALSGTGDVQLEVDTTYLNSLYPNVTVSRSQNLFLATPASGGAGAASFRNISVSDVPILNQNTTGNAGTATKLATARTINGVSFDGSANITVTAAAGTLSGTTLKSTVVSSSLTSVGTLVSLSVSGAITAGSLSAGTIDHNGAWTKSRFLGGTNTGEIYSDGSNLILANDGMIYLQSVSGNVLFAKGHKSGGDSWFEMMYNGSTRAKTVSGGFSVTGCGYYSNGIEVTGDVKATGDGYFFNSVSDNRLKTDLEAIAPVTGMDLVRNSKPYWFTWKEGKKAGKRDIGFIAQDMLEVLPEMVMHRPDGLYGLYYEHYVVVLTAAVQYLEQKLKNLERILHGQ
jgi:hypothetical protein